MSIEYRDPNKVPGNFSRVETTIRAETSIRGAQHHLTVTPNGWRVGNRVDSVTFSPPPTAPPVQNRFENAVVRGLATSVSNGFYDGTIGILKGVGNAPAVGLNGVTGSLANAGVGGLYFQGSNPFAVPLPFAYTNVRQASYGSAGSTGTLFGLGVAGGAVFGGSSTLSVVPEAQSSQITALARFYPENNGFLGATERTFLSPGDQISRYGSTSGRFFSPSGTPLSMRALPPNSNTSIFNNYSVLKPFEVEAGQIAPAFGETGLGTQFRSPVSADVLLRRGIIEPR